MKKPSRIILAALITATLATQTIAHASMSIPTRPPLAVGQGAAAPGGGSFLNSPIPSAVQKISLFDSSGKTFTLASLKGKTVVIANFLTSCQEICPMTSVSMRQIGDAVAASSLKNKVKVLEISVDGARDTPARLTAYQANLGSKTVRIDFARGLVVEAEKRLSSSELTLTSKDLDVTLISTIGEIHD